VTTLQAMEATGAAGRTHSPATSACHKITFPEDFDNVARLLEPGSRHSSIGKDLEFMLERAIQSRCVVWRSRHDPS